MNQIQSRRGNAILFCPQPSRQRSALSLRKVFSLQWISMSHSTKLKLHALHASLLARENELFNASSVIFHRRTHNFTMERLKEGGSWNCLKEGQVEGF